MPKSVVRGGARYFVLNVFAHNRTTVSRFLRRGLDGNCVPLLRRDSQPMVRIKRKLGIDRQPYRIAVFARKFDGEFHALGGAGRRYVAFILLGREDLLQKIFKLNLAPRTSRGDVRENPLEIADTGSQALHLPKTLLYLFQTFADQTEGFAESRFERGLQLLVNGLPH